jgi:hypothetical protein
MNDGNGSDSLATDTDDSTFSAQKNISFLIMIGGFVTLGVMIPLAASHPCIIR